jgi:hypothetical protein
MSASQLTKLYSPLDIPECGKEPFTDYSRWRLLVNDGGRHTWHYMKTDEECAKWPQNHIDKYWTGQPLVSIRSCVIHAMDRDDHDRTSPAFRKRPHRSKRLGTVIPFTSTSSRMMGTGLASMVDQCSCTLALSLGLMLLVWGSKRKNASR